jgi:hypothetical protein
MRFASRIQHLLAHRAELDGHPLWHVLQFPQSAHLAFETDRFHRCEIAFGLGVVLFADLLDRVPQAARYLRGVEAVQGRIVFDHGALRTVAAPCGELPPGEAAFTRFLTALGYRMGGTYPLTRLNMTGRAYVHEDLPEDLPQYFVSELHPECFSPEFQAAVTRVVSASSDPLAPADIARIECLRRDHALTTEGARALIDALARCFDRQHGELRSSDYETLLAESAEMAWIATEGNVFNHATDRVDDVHRLADALRAEGYPVKPQVEVSASGRVHQTALHAAPVLRTFVEDGHRVQREVPGSFYEFITRHALPGSEEGLARLDLAFDSGNATGIFRMTAAA